MKDHYDVLVVGAGIAGLTVAYEAALLGKSVLVCERDPSAKGASIRNFGMVWPIGQPPGPYRELALKSRAKWLQVTEEAGLWRQPTGSLHLAYREDELAVLEEFAALGKDLNYSVEILDAAQAIARSPHLRREGLLGAMWSPDEVCVNPRQAIAGLPQFLAERFGVDFLFSTPVSRIETGLAISSKGTLRASDIFLCSGGDLESLFPEVFAQHDIVRCKLQMLRARPKNRDFKIGPMLCAGLTLGHYANFQVCKGLPKLVERFKTELPEYERWKIHVLVSQHANGELTIGDSHEYDNNPSPFNREEIDGLILNYLDTFLPVDELEIVERWHGVYPKCMKAPFVLEPLAERVTGVLGLGGTGMTLSFGIAGLAVNGLTALS